MKTITIETTTIKVQKKTRDKLQEFKEEWDFGSIDQVIRYLLETEEKYRKSKVVRIVEE